MQGGDVPSSSQAQPRQRSTAQVHLKLNQAEKYCRLIRPFCITILYHNLLLFIDIFHI
jgi:hypothetical protein